MTQSEIDKMTTLPEFIAFFRSIPDEQWCVSLFTDRLGRHCARGHLGTRIGVPDCMYPADITIGLLAPSIAEVNNGHRWNAVGMHFEPAFS